MLENDLKLYYLQQLGIDCWVKREPHRDNELQKLAHIVSSCTRCDLHQTRTQTVFFRGNSQAKLMILGQSPDDVEDRAGQPLVGKAGALLDKMLTSIGLSDQDVYIAHLLKCSPPAHREPTSCELEACGHFLNQQIQWIMPKLILALGDFVGNFLLGTSASFDTLRSTLHHYDNTPLIVTYHPNFLLNNPQFKKQAYLDLLFVLNTLSDKP